MKNYVKPSIELNRFDAEDIIRTSGDYSTAGALSTNSKKVVEVYNTGVADADKITDATAAVEYSW